MAAVRRLVGAQLLRRVFEIDSAHRANCGRQIKIIAMIFESAVIERILTTLPMDLRGAVCTA